MSWWMKIPCAGATGNMVGKGSNRGKICHRLWHTKLNFFDGNQQSTYERKLQDENVKVMKDVQILLICRHGLLNQHKLSHQCGIDFNIKIWFIRACNILLLAPRPQLENSSL